MTPPWGELPRHWGGDYKGGARYNGTWWNINRSGREGGEVSFTFGPSSTSELGSPVYTLCCGLLLALPPGSCDVEHLFRINKYDRRRLTMHSLEMLLVVTRDAAPWIEYNMKRW